MFAERRWKVGFGYGLPASSTSGGTASSDANAANSRPAASWFHTTTDPESLPVKSPMGTVVVVMVPCSDHASLTRSHMCAPSSTVTDREAACVIGYQRNGFAHTTGLAAR